MQLNETKPYLETSGELEEQFFSIQDTGMIFDILRNKMYSNAILAIAREISCNARDAHRESGKPNLPIQIQLPNSLDPRFIVKDWGPGISPDRISNIFIKYTASTKRNDNIQTGGFGIGSKTPFSYTDSFTVKTNFNGTQYIYNCVIDPTKVGKLMLASEVPTLEPNGTEIIIPVFSKNFKEFATWTEHACRHWDIKPIIVGDHLEWTVFPKILEGNKWAICQTKDYYRNVKIIIDGVEYPLDLEVLKKYAAGSVIDSIRGNLIMYFNIGELSLSANREQIFLDEKTQNLIRERLLDIKSNIKQIVSNKIDAAANLYEANILYIKEISTIFNNHQYIGELEWKGGKISGTQVNTNCFVYRFNKRTKYSYKLNANKEVISRRSDTYIHFELDSELYLNDLPIREPTLKHIKKAYLNNPHLKTIQVVQPNDKITIDALNAAINLDKMEPKLLSSIIKASGRAYLKSLAPRFIIYKSGNVGGINGFRQVSYDAYKEDTNKKIICSLTKDSPTNRQPILNNKNYLNAESMRFLETKYPDISIYGVDSEIPASKIKENLKSAIYIEDFINSDVLDKKLNYLEIACAINNKDFIDDKISSICNESIPLIENTDSLYLKYVLLTIKIMNMSKENKGLIQIYESINSEFTKDQIDQYQNDHPEINILLLKTALNEKYPLLNYVDSYYFKDITSHLTQYINLIDKK